MLLNASKDKLDVKLKAVGFQFLRFNFENKKVDIDLSSVEKTKDRFFISQNIYRKQIGKQLSSSMRIVEMDKDSLFFDFKVMKYCKNIKKIFISNSFNMNAIYKLLSICTLKVRSY